MQGCEVAVDSRVAADHTCTHSQLYRLDTRFVRLRIVQEKDYLVLHQLRSSDAARYLHAIDSDPQLQREYIMRARLRARSGEDLYYAISTRTDLAKPVGFIRISDLLGKDHFSFHSLIVSSEAPSFVAVDALFTVLQVGFELLGYERSADLSLIAGNERMRALHRAMGILTEDRVEGEWVHLSANRSRFFERRDFYRRYGFGVDANRFVRLRNSAVPQPTGP
jgi:RimJ/RimL family protein N-acetyltransferase